MSRGRRILSMVTASIALLGLGFVVAVASGSRPGQGDEPWLDVSFRPDIDLTALMAWILLITAVIGAVLLALGRKDYRLPERKRGRSLLGVLLAVLLFFVAVRWLRPLAESFLGEAGDISPTITQPAEEPTEQPGGFWAGWLLGVLIVSVLAAVLTRIGLSIRSAEPLLEYSDGGDYTDPASMRETAPRRHRPLNDDLTSQVLNAYGRFEDSASRHGTVRSSAETEGRHARRAREELSLAQDDVDALLRLHADVRYGTRSPTQSEADDARRVAGRLVEEMGQ